MKTSYNRELERSQDLDYKLTNAKRVNRLSQPPPRSAKEFPAVSRYAAATAAVAGASESPTAVSRASIFSRTLSETGERHKVGLT